MSQKAKILDLTDVSEIRPEPPLAIGSGRPSDRCLRALESMEVISAFDRDYQHGSPIPAAIWEHAEIVSEYLGAPPAEEWFPMFLNRILEQ
jgi:hypothetical protein